MTDCNDKTICENEYDENGNLIGVPLPSSPGNNACITQPGGHICPDRKKPQTCKDFQLSENRDSCIIDAFVDEHINIGGTNANVFKLLGIHEQGRLVDLTEFGNPISSGDQVGFPKDEAFTTFVTEWRSAQKGSEVTASAFIGYDFGVIKLDNGRRRYGIDTSVKHNISTIKIKQGNNPQNRVTKARVERSDDSVTWYGAAIISLPDDDCWNTIHFRNTAPMRFWRIRPLEFNGGAGDHWAVQALEMFDYDLTSIDDIQDKIWNENRDRDYADESILIKGYYDLVDTQTELSRFGIELPSQTINLVVSFNATVAILGRPFVVGDIVELPSETQFNVKLEPIKKYMEVIDVTWATEGYTPTWRPLLQRIILQPMLATQETADIVGGLEGYTDDTGFFENFDKTHGMDDGDHPIFQDYSDIKDAIEQTACDENHLPERGADPADVTQFSENQIEAAAAQGMKDNEGKPTLGKLGLNPRQLYVEDGMPPNGLPFTEGDSLPPVETAKNGDYHRLTYTGISTNIPPRLYKFSAAKNRWIFVETDKRQKFNNTKPVLQEFISSPTRESAEKIGK